MTGVLSWGVWVSVRGTAPKGRVSAMVASVAGGLAVLVAVWLTYLTQCGCVLG